ncbi:PepSY-associated TM helix domain-containing protein [Sulfuriroseicoccus oceanibius]|uniref:PepSY domain-containing protein n=1 Tax=Sulfuriroseicoccus oceanibius TaxID=2707525 RepID=A0A6B3L8X9_9BACT|nr:PepSY-associated TM helix domain-containing protein [Sulfuriroseicoccus oceanibius]QQL44160.1 PepSY domain-containing protein [Sulfuriroseicoccus oceanibius]
MSETNNEQDPKISFQAGCSPVCDVVRRKPAMRKKRKARPGHRFFGLIVALPLVWVLLTGVVLNHSEDWGLNERKVSASWVLSMYGMSPAGEPREVAGNGHRLSVWDGVVFWDSQAMPWDGDLVTAVPLSGSFALVYDDAVVRVGLDGEVVERLDELSLPGTPLMAAGVADERLAVATAEGWSVIDEDWIEFTAMDEPANEVGLAALSNSDQVDELRRNWSGGGIPVARLVRDLHAGHFLGPWSAYFYDFVALCTLCLIGSGLVLQVRTMRRAKAHGQKA